jgi:hypothetical protein
MKTTIFAVAIFLLLAASNAQDIRVYCDGEILQYEVHWGFIRLGTITIQCKKCSYAGSDRYWLEMHVKSNPAIPFINIDEHNETLVRPDDGMSLLFKATHAKDGESTVIESVYEPDLRRVTYSERILESNQYFRFDILDWVDPYLDGPSLFFYARRMIRSQKKYTLPTMINGKIEKTVLDFTGPVEWLEVEAFDQPVKTRRYDGLALWEGGTSAGLSGAFSGWLTEDSAAVTVRAEMQVFLGSVIIELEEYNRPGWLPPVALQANK